GAPCRTTMATPRRLSGTTDGENAATATDPSPGDHALIRAWATSGGSRVTSGGCPTGAADAGCGPPTAAAVHKAAVQASATSAPAIRWRGPRAPTLQLCTGPLTAAPWRHW